MIRVYQTFATPRDHQESDTQTLPNKRSGYILLKAVSNNMMTRNSTFTVSSRKKVRYDY